MKHKGVMQKFLQTLFDITLLHPLDPYILIKLGDIQRTNSMVYMQTAHWQQSAYLLRQMFMCFLLPVNQTGDK